MDACDTFITIATEGLSRVSDDVVTKEFLATWKREFLAHWEAGRSSSTGTVADKDPAVERLRLSRMRLFAKLRPAEKHAVFWLAKETERVVKQAMIDLLRDGKYTATVTRLSKRWGPQLAKINSTDPLIEPMAAIVAANPSIANKDLPDALIKAGALKVHTVLRKPTAYEITATGATFSEARLAPKLSLLKRSREFQLALMEHHLGGKLPPPHPLLRT